MFKLTMETKGLMDRLKHLRERYLPRALAEALTKTAVAAKADLQHEMKDVFDRPSPWVLNAIFVKPATDKSLIAEVGFKEGGAHNVGRMLLPHVKGGARRLKASERAIAQVAAQQKTVSNNRFDKLLSGENYLAIGEGARRDHYGNIPRSEYVRILSRLKAFTKQGSAHNETARSKKRRAGKGPDYFIGAPGAGKLPFGVWARFKFALGTAIKPILIAIDRPKYEEGRFEFFFTVEHTFKTKFEPAFRVALTRWLGKVK